MKIIAKETWQLMNWLTHDRMPMKRLDNRNSQLRYGGWPRRSDTRATKDGEYSRVSSMQVALYPNAL